ncbi:hypothetical protein B7494_g3273 [Chlorociboria aeruginascens]|nr:hypothetical protein B7494_g3273 [Chlorociboria aeruginascens]
MASHVVVINQDLTKSTIKVQPGTFMSEVRDEACKNKGYSFHFELKNNGKLVDLTRPFRQTGLTSGAKLELVAASRSPTVVSIAIEPPPSLLGSRWTTKVPSNTTLWQILRKFETEGEGNLNVTERGVAQIENGQTGSGRIVYEMPTLNFMGRDLTTFEDLQKTLASVGLRNGNGLLRLGFRATDQPMQEALSHISEYFKEEKVATKSDAAGSSAAGEAIKGDAETATDAVTKLPDSEASVSEDIRMTSEENPEPVSQETPASTSTKRSAPITPEESILGPNQRPVNVYSPPTSDVPKATEIPHDPEDFNPSIADMKLHQNRMKEGSTNKRLLSDAEEQQLAEEKAARLARVSDLTIKVRFPDLSSVETKFNAQDSGAYLYAFVKGLIVAENQPFKLLAILDKNGMGTVPDDEKKLLIRDIGFRGRVVVNFHWGDDIDESVKKQSLLKGEYAAVAKALPVPEIPAAKETGEDEGTAVEKGKEENKSGGSKKGIPNWFKKGLKK